LKRDPTSEAATQLAIAETVEYGRSECSRQSNAVITSISHVILVRVTDDGVQHTQRLPFSGTIPATQNVAHRGWQHEASDHDSDEDADETGASRVDDGDIVETVDPSREANASTWIPSEGFDAISAIALVFEATALEE
jgi:hypothetical protein